MYNSVVYKRFCEKHKDRINKEKCAQRKEQRDANLEEFRIKEREYREANKERIKDGNSKWYYNNKESETIKSKEWNINNKDKVKEYNLAKYGINLEDWERMWQEQGGLCRWCGGAMKRNGKQTGKSVVVDHDHSLVGKDSVRGLCHRFCNATSVRQFEHDFISGVLRAFNYPFPLEQKREALKKLNEMFQ